MAPTGKLVSSALRSSENLYLEKRARPAKLDLIWDNWHSQAEKSSPSCDDSNDPRLASLERSTTHQLPLKPSAQVGTSKRWGMLRTKPKSTENSLNVGKDTDTRENRDKAVFIDQKVSMSRHMTKLKKKTRQNIPDATDAPYIQALPYVALPTTPITPQKRIVIPHSLKREHLESSRSAMYFTVDPDWNASKGEAADLFLLTNVTAYTSPQKVPQKVASAEAVSEPVRKNKRGRSFLTLE